MREQLLSAVGSAREHDACALGLHDLHETLRPGLGSVVGEALVDEEVDARDAVCAQLGRSFRRRPAVEHGLERHAELACQPPPEREGL